MSLSASFWHDFPRAFCFPDHCNCEAFSSSLIMQPIATITSLPIVFLGIVFILQAHKRGASPIFGLLTIMIGAASTFLHMSFIKIGIVLDFSGIILMFLWFFFRSNSYRLKYYLFYYIASVISCILILYFLEPIRHELAAVCAVAGIYALLSTTDFKSSPKGAKQLKISLVIFIGAFICMQLDLMRIWCVPQSLFHGHSLWHIGVALALYCAHSALVNLNSNLTK